MCPVLQYTSVLQRAPWHVLLGKARQECGRTCVDYFLIAMSRKPLLILGVLPLKLKKEHPKLPR